jgi:hypothetical protein
MSSQLNDLDSDALLVMYLAGELTNGDKAALERRLANEPALAAELQRVRDAQAFFGQSMQSADAHAKMPVGEGVAVRRVSRAMQQWQIDRIRATPPAQKKGLPFPWWSYPVAVAASLIIAFLVWSSRQPVGSIDADQSVANNTPGDNPDTQPDEPPPAQDMTEWMASSFDANPETTVADDAPTILEDSLPSLFPTREETLQ